MTPRSGRFTGLADRMLVSAFILQASILSSALSAKRSQRYAAVSNHYVGAGAL